MKLALLTLLLTVAAPVPFAESAAGIEEDVVVESSRSTSPRAPRRKQVYRPVGSGSPVRFSPRDLQGSLPLPETTGWSPRLFSRPPPLG